MSILKVKKYVSSPTDSEEGESDETLITHSEASAVDTVVFRKTARPSYGFIDLTKRVSHDDQDQLTVFDEHLFIAKLRKLSEDAQSYKLSSSDESSVDTKECTNQLSRLEAIGIISVLESTVDKLHILAHTNNKPSAKPDMTYRTLQERFGDRDEKATLIDVETDVPMDIAIDAMKMKKIQMDRGFLETTLSNTIDELKMYGRYSSLSKMVLQELLVRMEENHLIEEEKTNRGEMLYLTKHIAALKKKMAEDLDRTDETIARLRDKLQDRIFQGNLENQFMNKWETSRAEQHALVLEMKEKSMQENLTNSQIAIDMETRVNNEIEAYIRSAGEKLEDEIQFWTEKSEKELRVRDDEISVVAEQRDQQLRQLEALAKVYQERESEIQAYLAYKEQRSQKAAHEKFLNDMATRIQAWWKGTMVRRGLGPYKRRRKGKDKKGKGSAKGKKGKK